MGINTMGRERIQSLSRGIVTSVPVALVGFEWRNGLGKTVLRTTAYDG